MKMNGLSNKEVEESKSKYGDNRLSEIETETFLEKFIDNFKDPMIRLLNIALLINITIFILGAIGIIHSEIKWYEPFGIGFAIVLATLVSTFSEYKNENAFHKLQEEASKINCKVYRNGDITLISIDNIVVGDIVLLQTGDKIPADGIIINGEIKVDQSVLNGESKEITKISKSINLNEAKYDFLDNFSVFRGSVVCGGNAIMQVISVGDKSIYGTIASELQQDSERLSPLKLKLSKLANDISKFGYIGGISIAIAVIIRNVLNAGGIMEYISLGGITIFTDLINSIILAVIIIVMAVPEGLPLMIAIVSSLNMSKMLKDNILVRKITGIETAGSLNLLFSDKTGTITKGELEVVTFFNGDTVEILNVCDVKGELGKLLSISIYHNTDAIISNNSVIGGNATEKACLKYISSVENIKNIDKVRTISFSSVNKYSATEIKGEYNFTLIKGAPEKILNRCKYYYNENGDKIDFALNKGKIDNLINELANRAIRVIAIAITEESLDGDKLPKSNNWRFIGILGIRDEIRSESISAINEVKNSGIQVVMITGDRKDTAIAIASESGLLTDDTNIVLTSDELQKLTDDEIKEILPNIRVIARALPSDKSRLVNIGKELGLVIGMTGDGVNDSPALKKSDVGFAMGSGTEVSKEASDIVILDDNFNSIEKAILYGRTIFNSIRKFIIFQLTINVAAVIISFIAPLLGINSPLTVIQILWINLVMDTLAAIAFGGEPALRRFMDEKPKSRSENIVNRYMWSSILTGAIWVSILGLALLTITPLQKIFVTGYNFPDTFFNLPNSKHMWDLNNDNFIKLGTGYFTFFIFSSVFNAFNARTEKINIFENIKNNKGFLQIIILIILIQILMTYFGGAILRCNVLNFKEWSTIIIMSISIIPVDMIRKLIYEKFINV
ncbi:MAG: calcium-translocating P-type ATPase, PMCA-type [Fusobacteria bacterium]|nr:calcium-translocating P-type ATPase, PMCA-type [Fusobacteriota bacterium]